MQISKNSTYSIDHIDLNTNDMVKTREFYLELFVNYLNWDIIYDSSEYFMIGKLPGLRIGFSPVSEVLKNGQFSKEKIGLHHFAILVHNREIVDNIYNKLLEMNCIILDKPNIYPQYHQSYYAVYYQDPNGFKMEFVCYEKTST